MEGVKPVAGRAVSRDEAHAPAAAHTRLASVSSTARHVILRLLHHDALNLAQSSAYSAMVALFPALIVSGAVLSLLPEFSAAKAEIGSFFDQVLPSDVYPMLNSYFAPSTATAQTTRVLVVAAVVSLTGGSSVMATVMEGIRRAENLPRHYWSFWHRRLRALLLVPLLLLPLAAVTILVIFGQIITSWLVSYVSPTMQPLFNSLAFVTRWSAALIGVAGLTVLIYLLGTPARLRWSRVWPGALLATALWFIITLSFGWYVTRFANYSQVYGSLGAGIALLFWLYIVVLSLLCGAEFNAELAHGWRPEREEDRPGTPKPGTTSPAS